MPKTLTQTEIDALFSRIQASPHSADRKPPKSVVSCDLRTWNKLSNDQVAAVTALHETFARRLGSSLGALLRVACGMNLASVEQMTYGEFLGRVPEITYLASLHVMPIDVRAAIRLDIDLAYPIVDVLLGGTGTAVIEPRDLTEIEEQILETVFRLVVQDLHDTWAPVLDLDFRFELRQQNLQIHGLMLPGEKVLCLNFELALSESAGTLALILPAVVVSALLRRLSLQGSYSERIPSRESRRRMRERLLDCGFRSDLSLPRSALPVRQLIDLEPGQVLVLPKRADDPIHFNIAGKPMFSAYPVRHGSQRGARIAERLALHSRSSKEPTP